MNQLINKETKGSQTLIFLIFHFAFITISLMDLISIVEMKHLKKQLVTELEQDANSDFTNEVVSLPPNDISNHGNSDFTNNVVSFPQIDIPTEFRPVTPPPSY